MVNDNFENEKLNNAKAIHLQQEKGLSFNEPFPRMTYQEAMSRFGSDRPDTRFGLELVEISDLVKDSQFKVFSEVVQKGGQVKGINGKGCSQLSRKEIDDLTNIVAIYKAKGLAWIKINPDDIQSPLKKFLSDKGGKGEKRQKNFLCR